MNDDQLTRLLEELRALPKETEWVEYKVGNENPQKIGENISTLSNSAALLNRERAWIVWGVEDGTSRVVGTAFRPRSQLVGGEELENWLHKNLHPQVDFNIHEFSLETGKRIVVLEVFPAPGSPVRFKSEEHIRIGSYTRKLKDFPEKERVLWGRFSTMRFEDGIALQGLTGQRVLELIDYPECFRLLRLPMPDGRSGILGQLAKEGIIIRIGEDEFQITNLGAILFAYRLGDFQKLKRKSVRVIEYEGRDRIRTLREQEATKGYAVGFEGLIGYIHARLPANEEIGQAFRREVPVYPGEAIRELVPNALVHQDFSLEGTGPMIELFTDRMEITNPGQPLIDVLRFMDEPPRSRNEALAGMMRRMNIIEERGTGIDKVITAIELYQLPPPNFQVTPNHTRVTLLSPRSLAEMDKGDRVRACYQHACLKWLASDKMSNESLRERLNIDKSNYPMASRIIKEALDAGLVRRADTGSNSNRDRRYIPFWADGM
ncbi:MAG: ATP-binding protein [Sumerlaeia bacterium]